MTTELTDDLIGTNVVIGDGGSDREQQEQFPASAIQEITDHEIVLSGRP